MSALEVESDVFFSLRRLFNRGDLKREDVLVGEAARAPSYRFSLACRVFGLKRDPDVEAAFESLREQPSASGLCLLLRLCHVPCGEVVYSRNRKVVEIYIPNRTPVVLWLSQVEDEWLVRVNLKQGFDTDYMLTPESMASLVQAALRAT